MFGAICFVGLVRHSYFLNFSWPKCALKKASVKICKRSPSLAVKLHVIRCAKTEHQFDVYKLIEIMQLRVQSILKNNSKIKEWMTYGWITCGLVGVIQLDLDGLLHWACCSGWQLCILVHLLLCIRCFGGQILNLKPTWFCYFKRHIFECISHIHMCESFPYTSHKGIQVDWSPSWTQS